MYTNEVLFWKVFHNKYLFNYIINQIPIDELDVEINRDQLKISRFRCKFKDTYSLNTMISNKLYSLIRNKIQHNDYIRIDKDSIKTLFNQMNYYKDQNEKELISILELLLTKRRVEFEICDLTKLAIKCSNIKVFKILIGEPYSVIVYPRTLIKLLKLKPPVEFIKEILSTYGYKSNIIMNDGDKMELSEFINKNETKIEQQAINSVILKENDGKGNIITSSPSTISLLESLKGDYETTKSIIQSLDSISFDVENEVIDKIKWKNDMISLKSSKINFNENANFGELKSIIEMIINKYSNTTTTTLKETIGYIINYLYSMCLRIKEITLTQIKEVRQILFESSIEISHGICESILYLRIKDKRLFKYVHDRMHYIIDFDINNSLGEGVHTSSYLKCTILTFDYIFNPFFSFNDILNELVDQVSYRICLFDDKSGYHDTYCKRSLNQDLIYFLQIKSFNLFFKHLKWIDQFIYETSDNNNNLKWLDSIGNYNSASTIIKTTKSTINPTPPPIPTSIPKEDGQTTILIKAFEYSDKALESIIKVLNIEQIQKFIIEHNFYVSNFINHLYSISIKFDRFEIAEYLLGNYSIKFSKFPTTNYLELKLFLKNRYQELIKNPNPIQFELDWLEYHDELLKGDFFYHIVVYLSNSMNGIDHYRIITDPSKQELRNFFDRRISQLHYRQKNQLKDMSPMYYYNDNNSNKKQEIEAILNQPEIKELLKTKLDYYLNSVKSKRLLEIKGRGGPNHILEEPFYKGDIQVCDLILKLGYYQSNQIISKKSISNALSLNNIHIIKYYYKEYIKEDKELYEHLKKELSSYTDYSFDLYFT